MTVTSANGPDTPEFLCPFCGCGKIAELALSVVLHEVTKWDPSGEPEEYEAAVVDWETDFSYALLNRPYRTPPVTFECRKCCEHFQKPRRADQPITGIPGESSSRRRYGCPNCLSQDVVEQLFVPADYTGSFFEDENGKVSFERDKGDPELLWEPEEARKLPYRCMECSHQFREPTEITRATYKANLARSRER